MTLTISTGATWVTTRTLPGSPNNVVSGSNATLEITGNYLLGSGTSTAAITIFGGNGTSTGQDIRACRMDRSTPW